MLYDLTILGRQSILFISSFFKKMVLFPLNGFKVANPLEVSMVRSYTSFSKRCMISKYWIGVNLLLLSLSFFPPRKMEREVVTTFIPMALPPGLLALGTWDFFFLFWWRKTTGIYSLHFLRPEVPNQDVSKVGSFWMLQGRICAMPLS